MHALLAVSLPAFTADIVLVLLYSFWALSRSCVSKPGFINWVTDGSSLHSELFLHFIVAS